MCAVEHPHDVELHTLAFRQHGIVSTAQLRALGMERGAVESWRRRGLLHSVHRGVSAVGHGRLDWRGRLWAAALAANAALSHRGGGAVWELMAIPGGRIEVTTRGHAHSTARILVHRSRTLRDEDVVLLDGLPVTSPTRTIQDLAGVLNPQRLTRVLHNAEHRRILDAAKLATPLPGRRSVALRRGLDQIARTG